MLMSWEVLCIGANWMHDLSMPEISDAQDKLLAEGKERRVWTWIVLCDDSKSFIRL